MLAEAGRTDAPFCACASRARSCDPRVLLLAHRVEHLLANEVEDAIVQSPELRGIYEILAARSWQVDRDDFLDPARPGRHYHDLIPEQNGLIDGVRDEDDRLAHALENAGEF